jgi:anti-sigma regulatory factor (Ser/Thr protein kinase)
MPPAEVSPSHDGGAARSVSFAARLPPDGASAAAARRLVRTRLGQLVATPTLEDVLLVVSELVTNAVRHGRGNIELRIAFDGERVRGDVGDEGGGFTRRARPRPAGAVGGNGLRIVEQLATTWGVHDGSAQIWFEIPGSRAAQPTRLN